MRIMFENHMGEHNTRIACENKTYAVNAPDSMPTYAVNAPDSMPTYAVNAPDSMPTYAVNAPDSMPTYAVNAPDSFLLIRFPSKLLMNVSRQRVLSNSLLK